MSVAGFAPPLMRGKRAAFRCEKYSFWVFKIHPPFAFGSHPPLSGGRHEKKVAIVTGAAKPESTGEAVYRNFRPPFP